MNWMWNLVVMLQILAALGMIGLVLVQHGKGADMGASFGSGASGSLFGATGSANFLSRSTAVLAAVFFVCTLALAYLANDRSRPIEGGSSVLDRPATVAPAASSASTAGGTSGAQIPGGTAAVPAQGAAPATRASSPAQPSPAPAGASGLTK